jgi:hypothetical protein
VAQAFLGLAQLLGLPFDLGALLEQVREDADLRAQDGGIDRRLNEVHRAERYARLNCVSPA